MCNTNIMTEYEKNTGMTLQAHKNRVMLKVVVYGALIFFGYKYLKKKVK